MSYIVKSVKGYTDWEAFEVEQALQMADELIEAYNTNRTDEQPIVRNTHKFLNCSKERATYKLLKVWHILSGSGIFLHYELKTRGHSLWVYSSMSRQLAEYIDKDDSDTEVAAPPNTCQ